MTLESYNKLPEINRIGIDTPILEEVEIPGVCLDIKLKPPKMPKNFEGSKKTYRNLFIRSLKHSSEHHIYSSDGLYIVSLYKSLDEAKLWIDKRYDEIKERVNECKRISST